MRDAEARTGIVAADFSRIRQVKLDRFTIDQPGQGAIFKICFPRDLIVTADNIVA